MGRRKEFIRVIVIGVLISLGLIIAINILSLKKSTYQTDATEIKAVSSQISADGVIASQNEALLHFQTGGKLSYLPYHEGDRVYQGQTIASLDTYALQKQLQLAANSYQTTKNNVDQALENNNAGVLEGQQRVSLDTTSKQGYSSITEATVVYDAVKRIVNNDLLAQNSAQINVDIANYSVSLASLTAPFNGIILHEDVTVPNVNVTPVTTFRVADPDAMIFRAHVSDNDIDYVSLGSQAQIHVNGISKIYTGTVVDIHPDKITLPTGEGVYEVDISSLELKKIAKFDQEGFAQIKSNTDSSVRLVPKWTVLSGQLVWVEAGGKNVLRVVKLGKTHGNMVEVLSGLGDEDKLIIEPKSIIDSKYTLL